MPLRNLRHTLVTIALQNNADIKTVPEKLEHYSAGFALNNYAHFTTAAQWQAVSAVHDGGWRISCYQSALRSPKPLVGLTASVKAGEDFVRRGAVEIMWSAFQIQRLAKRAVPRSYGGERKGRRL